MSEPMMMLLIIKGQSLRGADGSFHSKDSDPEVHTCVWEGSDGPPSFGVAPSTCLVHASRHACMLLSLADFLNLAP